MRRSIPAALGLAILAPGAASAAVLSATFEFTVTEIRGLVPSGALAVGETLDATFGFDTEVTALAGGRYQNGFVSVSGFGASVSGSSEFSNDLGSDFSCCFDRAIIRGNIPAAAGAASVVLIDEDGEVLGGPGLPSAFDFSLIDAATLSIGLFEGATDIIATYSRPEMPGGGGPDMPAIPLPASLPLLAAGLGLLARVRQGQA